MNISNKARQHAESCRFCWMCRHVCPVGNADGQERNTARARALMVAYVIRGTEKDEDIASNMYECTLCGACTNNCKTGWDPKIFIQEVKTQLILDQHAPDYIVDLLKRYFEKGTIFQSERVKLEKRKTDTLVIFSPQAMHHDQETVEKAYRLLNDATIDENAFDTGYTLWFLTGKTAETVAQAKKCAEAMNQYKEVVVYHPAELSFILHEYHEWGIEVKAKIIGFHEKLLSMLSEGKLKVRKNDNEYSVQDHYALARELDDVTSCRKIVEYVGKNKEMLLIGKEANMAGSLIMAEYMEQKMLDVAAMRWQNAINMGCKTLVTCSPDEHVLLRKTAPEGYRVVSLEELLLEHI